jgi:hypothetical protein
MVANSSSYKWRYLNNIRCGTSRSFRNNLEYLKEKINELETNTKEKFQQN